MSSFSSPQIVANTVIMARTVEPNKTALLIEGDKDTRIYRKVTDQNHCRTYAAGNRAHAEGALEILKAAKQPGVLALVDADTDYLHGKKMLILTFSLPMRAMLSVCFCRHQYCALS